MSELSGIMGMMVRDVPLSLEGEPGHGRAESPDKSRIPRQKLFS